MKPEKNWGPADYYAMGRVWGGLLFLGLFAFYVLADVVIKLFQ